MLGLVITHDFKLYKKEFTNPLYESVEPVLEGYMEIVHPVNLPEPFRMLVNEEGHLKFLPFNPVGCCWYEGAIVGNVIVMKQGMTDEGPDILGLTEEECLKVIGMVSEISGGEYRYIEMEETK